MSAHAAVMEHTIAPLSKMPGAFMRIKQVSRSMRETCGKADVRVVQGNLRQLTSRKFFEHVS
jgi:hypothetical protein